MALLSWKVNCGVHKGTKRCHQLKLTVTYDVSWQI